MEMVSNQIVCTDGAIMATELMMATTPYMGAVRSRNKIDIE